MKNFLNGNFEVKRPPTAPKVQQDLTDRFEQEALKRLGGSIAFVSKKKFLYGAGPLTEERAQSTPERPAGSARSSNSGSAPAAASDQKQK